MTTQTFLVDGMTCGHCVAAVTSELEAVAAGASIEVILGEPSTVTIEAVAQLSDEEIAFALDEAGGYRLHSTAGS